VLFAIRLPASSTTGIAANLLGRKFVGIEKEDEFINIAMKRKSELDANFDLFKRRILDINKLD
jgi:DNA (cytosine-5-)-methyltransferase